MEREVHISDSVIRRLPRYYRFLGELINEGVTKISSRELSERMKLTASQIRQDLNCFGGFGQQGYGYNVHVLRTAIGEILGVNSRINTILVGAGNLGRAVAMHLDFEKNGCKLTGIFDINLQLENIEVSGIPVMHTTRLAQFCEVNHPKIAVLCIPKEGAKAICESLINLGIHSFWNFSHYDIKLDYEGVTVENVHLGDSLLTLAYKVNNRS